MEPSKVVMLVANETNPTNLRNADKLRTLFQSKKIVWEEIDGTDPTNKEKRSELFVISGLRAEYPQVFFRDSASCQYSFIGNYGKVSTLNENAEMILSHPEILEHNPDVADQVFDKVFAEVMPASEVIRPIKITAKQKRTQLLRSQEEKITATEVKATVEETNAEASMQTNIVEEQIEENAEKEEKETKAEQIVESYEVLLLENDAAEDVDELKEDAEEDQKQQEEGIDEAQMTDKAQPLRKRDRLKRWFKRMTGSHRRT